MLAAFHKWFEERRAFLEAAGIRLDLSRPTSGSLRNTIHAELRSDQYELLIQLWDDGLADFHFLDWARADDGVQVTHTQFHDEGQLLNSLEKALMRVGGSPPSSGSFADPGGRAAG